ncbi:putative holliday junction resolvase [Azospirillaceae bacterium]
MSDPHRSGLIDRHNPTISFGTQDAERKTKVVQKTPRRRKEQWETRRGTDKISELKKNRAERRCLLHKSKLEILTPTMAICNITDLKARLRPGYRLLGLDLGSKTIGMALSDPGFMIASPIGTIRRANFPPIWELAKIAKEAFRRRHGSRLPVNMDGSEGASAQSARQFAKCFAKRGFV